MYSSIVKCHFLHCHISNFASRESINIGSAISTETPPVDCQFDNAANVFSNFLTIIANLDFC
jgi:hypothetical protein